MTELEQRLTNELSKLAGQYAEDQKRLAGQVEHLEEQVRGLAENYGQAVSSFKALENATQLLRKGPPKDGRTHHEIDQRLRRTDQRVRGFRRSVQLARGGFERTFSLIHAEAEQKRKTGDRWDRVEGRIESLCQGRVRSRSHDFDR